MKTPPYSPKNMDPHALSQALNRVPCARSVWGFWFRLGAFVCGAMLVITVIMSSCTQQKDPVSQIRDEHILRIVQMRTRLAYERNRELNRIIPVVEPEKEKKLEVVPAWIPIKAWVTGYCPCAICCGSHSDGKTSTGVKTDYFHGDAWGIAADLDILPSKTRIVVPGYDPTQYRPPNSPWKVDDTGGRMRRASKKGILHIDVRFIHHRSAKRWGSGWRTIYIETKNLSKEQIAQLSIMNNEAEKSGYRGQ